MLGAAAMLLFFDKHRRWLRTLGTMVGLTPLGVIERARTNYAKK
jgi:hypothetical protein